MKKTARFAAWVAEYVDYQRQLGYKIKEPERNLKNLANFMDREAPGQSLTDTWVLRWREANAHRSPRILSSLPPFLPWLTLRDPKTAVSKALFYQCGYSRQTPYIYDPEEMDAMMDAAGKRLDHRQDFSQHTNTALLGLLASTGLRIGESLELDRNDVDLRDAELRVRESKGVPLRMVPLHESTTEALRRYAAIRDRHHRVIRSNRFFVNPCGDRLRYNIFWEAFRALLEMAGVPFHSHPRPPRIHDLRHTFATRYLLRVRHEGGDIHCAVADLAVYLGHRDLKCVYWYLTGIPELMALCGERFRAYVEKRRREDQP